MKKLRNLFVCPANILAVHVTQPDKGPVITVP